jgi:hypothetical protein
MISFAKLQATLGGRIGLAVSGLGTGQKVQQLGNVNAVIAWSTSKVPIAPARLSAAYERTVRGSLKCSKRAVSANQVIAAAASPSSVRTNRPAGLAIPVCASGV